MIRRGEVGVAASLSEVTCFKSRACVWLLFVGQIMNVVQPKHICIHWNAAKAATGSLFVTCVCVCVLRKLFRALVDAAYDLQGLAKIAGVALKPVSLSKGSQASKSRESEREPSQLNKNISRASSQHDIVLART